MAWQRIGVTSWNVCGNDSKKPAAELREEELFMKRVSLMIACALATTTAPLVPISTALASPAGVQHCRSDVLPNVPEANLGECVSYNKVSDKGFPAHDCDAFLETAPDIFFLFYDSYSECVRAARETD
jgi:hypothetical protein